METMAEGNAGFFAVLHRISSRVSGGLGEAGAGLSDHRTIHRTMVERWSPTIRETDIGGTVGLLIGSRGDPNEPGRGGRVILKRARMREGTVAHTYQTTKQPNNLTPNNHLPSYSYNKLHTYSHTHILTLLLPYSSLSSYPSRCPLPLPLPAAC
jgi:hypothetical protein